MAHVLERLKSPVGEVLLVTGEAGAIRALDFGDYEARMARLWKRYYGESPPAFAVAPKATAARKAVEAYFEGELAAIEALSTETGGTMFQREVWKALRDIPRGKTETYGELAERIGRAKAVRAVGLANGANPVGIVVPCHRVIGANGTLTGYGGGIERKRWLLQHEGAWVG
ncbi:MAG: methylated-DNA--[protein]-cysteine S-methyltransferase [Alphaproteobacteria bacterium]